MFNTEVVEKIKTHILY